MSPSFAAMTAKTFRSLMNLTKFGIVIFVVLSGLAGYFVSFETSQVFEWTHLLSFVLGIAALSAGSLALNQFQDREMDGHMPRTGKRPLVNGEMSPSVGLGIALGLLFAGSLFLLLVSHLSLLLGWLVLVLYNGLYTLWWKPRWSFAAVPGAIPGALPVTMGYAANSPHIFSEESIYLFLILFLWQMPHFWALALKYQPDYQAAKVPVLPVALGRTRTFLHMGFYTFLYVGMALVSPWFIHSGWLYLILIIPSALWVLYEFICYFDRDSRWLRFFMGINLSVLIFLFIPAIEKWTHIFY